MKIFLISIILILSSCSTQRFVTDKKYYKVQSPNYKKTDHFTFWGIGQTKITTDAEDKCADNNKKLASVQFKQTVPNYLLTFVTLGIYSPRTLEVFCIK